MNAVSLADGRASCQVTVLANGLRIVSQALPEAETVALGVWVGAGARNETLAENGVSHFLEHMAFKGTRNRTARRIAEEIEAVGGDLNAATSLETTAYFARVLKGDEGVALELIADILQNPVFAEEELAREREVVFQEIAACQDDPGDLAYDLLAEAAFPDQPAGRPVTGTPASVARLTAQDLQGFLGRHYSPRNMVLSAAGAVRHDGLVRLGTALLGGPGPARGAAFEPARYAGGLRAWDRRFEQSHLLVGFEAPSYRDAGFYAVQVLSGLLGGGMSSRLFQEVRENRGLCYAIYSSAWGLWDSGMFTVHAAARAKSLPEVTRLIADELCRLADAPPAAGEVARAKAQLKVSLMMSAENAGARAEQLARQLLAYGRIVPNREILDKVEAVTPEDVYNAARRLVSGPPSVAVAGAGRASHGLARDALRRLEVLREAGR